MHQSAFLYLHQKAKLHSKVKHEMYTDMKGSSYFFDPRITSDKAKLIFQFRTRMYGVRNNFRNKYVCTLCPLCGQVEDSQEHLFQCHVISNYRIHNIATATYEDIFSNDVECLLRVVKDVQEVIKIREELCPL